MPKKLRKLSDFIESINDKVNNMKEEPKRASPLAGNRGKGSRTRSPARRQRGSSLFDYLSRREPRTRPPKPGGKEEGAPKPAYRAEAVSALQPAGPRARSKGGDSEERILGGQAEAGPVRVQSVRRGEAWYLGDFEGYVESAKGYLLDVRYDGDLGRAVAFIYDDEKGRLVRWVDRTGHRPYFLTDATPEDLGSMKPPISSDERVASIEVVSKIHPITRERVKLTKIVVTDPLAVRSLRERVKSAGYNYWEADIRYHHNYVFDHGLIPGMLYSVDSSWRRLHSIDRERVAALIEELFGDEPEEFKELAREWYPVFEQPPPQPPRIAVDIEVYSPGEGELPDPEKAPYPVISIALADDRGMRKVLLLARSDAEPGDLAGADYEVELFDSEAALILEALRIMSKYPVIITFNGDNFDIPYLYNRLIVLGYEPERLPFEFRQDHVSFRNNLHVDLFKVFDTRALQVYAFGNAYREKNLDSIASALIGEAKIQLEKHVSELTLRELADYNMRDSDLTLKLTTFAGNLVWNLIILLMRISRLGLEDVTRTQVSGWIKSLMNWEHRRRGFLIPSREEIKEIGGKAQSVAVIKDKKYKGAIVLQPPQGVFFNITVLDFASLYPSIIKNWNISYETVNNPYCRGETRIVPEVGHRICMSIKGISSLIVGLLKDFRVRIYKKKAKDKSLPEEERLWYNTVQAAMKVYVNASYGVFGTETFHLYSLAVAESVTAIGRSVLKATLQKAREIDLMILYGDTDSIFVWDPPGDKLGEIMDFVKREYGLDLEKDKEFSIGLFSGLKKNYIGITRDGGIVIKGMVGRKSNTPEFIKKEFQEAVRILTRLHDPEQVPSILEELRMHVREIYRKLRRREYMLDELAIRVMLSKDPGEYKKNTPQHVKAALLLRKYGIRATKGTIVSFVKTRDRLGVKPVKLAKLSEVDTSKYQEYVKTVFEQMLLAFGIRWGAMGTTSLAELARH